MKGPQRILQIVTRPQRRGAEIFAFDLSRQFSALGKDVKTVYLYDYEGENPLPLYGADVCLRGAEDHFLERSLGFHPGLLYRVIKHIRAFGPEVVQVNGSRSIKYGAAAKQFSRAGSKWKLVYRNIGIPSDWHHRDDTLLAYRFIIMPKMDGVIGVSQRSLTDARALYRLEGPAEVISNAVSPSRLTASKSRDEIRSEQGIGDDDLLLLYLGALEAAKRPDRFVRVVAGVSRSVPKVRAWIVGSGPLESSLRDLVDALDMKDRIRFLGNQSDVVPYLLASDLLVLTSETEGVPATVLEAAYLGLPSVATNVGGLAECISSGHTGMLVEDGYQEGLVKAIESLAMDKEKRKGMGQQARERALRDFTIDRIALRYLDFYQSLSDWPHNGIV